MEKRKTKKADLERKRSMFFQIGLIIALSLVLAAFEWSIRISKTNTDYTIGGIDLETEMVPITRQEEIKPPSPKHFEKFVIVDNENEIEEVVFEPPEIDPGEKLVFVQPLPDEIEDDTDDTLVFAEKQPEFPGGLTGLKHYLSKKINYPLKAAEEGIQGKVFVRFVVNKNGAVKDASIVRGVDPLLDTEALRVVKNMPKWKAGEQAGRPVSVWYTIPIVFILE